MKLKKFFDCITFRYPIVIMLTIVAIVSVLLELSNKTFLTNKNIYNGMISIEKSNSHIIFEENPMETIVGKAYTLDGDCIGEVYFCGGKYIFKANSKSKYYNTERVRICFEGKITLSEFMKGYITGK